MNGTPDMMIAGMKMIAALTVVLAMVFFLLYGIKKMSGRRLGAVGAKQIQILESQYLGVKKTISLVHVPGKVLVLGVTGDRISLLDTLDENSVVPSIPSLPENSFGPLLAERIKHFGKRIKGKDKL